MGDFGTNKEIGIGPPINKTRRILSAFPFSYLQSYGENTVTTVEVLWNHIVSIQGKGFISRIGQTTRCSPASGRQHSSTENSTQVPKCSLALLSQMTVISMYPLTNGVFLSQRVFLLGNELGAKSQLCMEGWTPEWRELNAQLLIPGFRNSSRAVTSDYSSGYFSANLENTKENKYYVTIGLCIKTHTLQLCDRRRKGINCFFLR